MSSKSNSSKRYTPEFKRDAVELARSSGRTVTEVARDLGVSSESLRAWVNQAKVDQGEGPAGALMLLAIDKLAGEGFDAPGSTPCSSPARSPSRERVIQQVGRIMRNTETNKSHVEAHDYLDADVPWLERMHDKRRRILERRGFTATTPDNLPQQPAHPVVPARRRPEPSRSATTPPVAEVRRWAKDQGMDVPPRGRLRSDIWDAWHDAHPQAQPVI